MYAMPTQWKHCPEVDNPADYVSRGMKADQLKGLDIWWREPASLSKGVELWPREAGTKNNPRPNKGRTLVQFYTYRILHLFLTHRTIVPIGLCCVSRLEYFASYETSAVPTDHPENEQRESLLKHACTRSRPNSRND